ncbi:MAG: deoxyribonuclease V [Thermomonas sp.]
MTKVTSVFPDWDGSTAALRALQSELAAQLVLRDKFAKPLRTVAGFDVGFEEGGTITRAAAVLLDANTLEVIANEVARLPTRMPYIPGLLSFRELPALLAALELLPQAPDLAFIDGHGIAHPRRLGIAAHFGVVTGLPSIGVAKKILVGESRTNLHDMRGAFTPLRHGAEQIGWILRSKPGCLPLIISPGHRVAMASTPELVMRYVTTYRLPETTRLADRLASRRDRKASASS